MKNGMPTAMGIPILNALWTVEGRINSVKSTPITVEKLAQAFPNYVTGKSSTQVTRHNRPSVLVLVGWIFKEPRVSGYFKNLKELMISVNEELTILWPIIQLFNIYFLRTVVTYQTIFFLIFWESTGRSIDIYIIFILFLN